LGRRDNVVLGLTDLETYTTRNPNFGATVGRYAGRIGGARFALDGAEYRLPKNEGENCLHGGIRGFAKRVWRIERATASAATLEYTSADGEEGFPGRLRTRVTFTVDGATLRLAYDAEADRPTVLNLTNHSYFNLAGEGSGDVFGHELRIEADRILELDQHSIPTGAMLEVAGTPFDFRAPHPIGARIRVAHEQILFGLGYDACFVLNGAGMRTAAVVREAGSGRVMTVRTDQPSVQLYTANKLTGALAGPSGRVYRSGDGLCLETQHFPDSPNRPGWPSTMLRPGEVFRSTTEYAFAAV
jgi:aldose 1-epimerase